LAALSHLFDTSWRFLTVARALETNLRYKAGSRREGNMLTLAKERLGDGPIAGGSFAY
jgi:hypothetical protein